MSETTEVLYLRSLDQRMRTVEETQREVIALLTSHDHMNQTITHVIGELDSLKSDFKKLHDQVQPRIKMTMIAKWVLTISLGLIILEVTREGFQKWRHGTSSAAYHGRAIPTPGNKPLK